MSRALLRLTAAKSAELIRRRELSPVELTDAVLERIQETEPLLRAYVDVRDGEARELAEWRAAEASRGEFRGPLHGVPFAVKDVFDVAGTATRLGSEATSSEPRERDAEAVRRLRQAGAVVVGKTVTHEFAYGVTSPPTANPWSLDRVPGGSSGGSAAAVAAHSAPFGLGSDCSGSVRIPAALCGVLGYKPTYGLISRRGCTPLAWSMDHVGILAKNAVDAAVACAAMAGPDRRDEGSVSRGRWGRVTVPDPRAWRPDVLRGLRVGVADRYFDDHIDEPVAKAVTAALSLFEQRGAVVVPISLPHVEYAMEMQYSILRPEASAYHASTLAERGDSIGPRVRHLLEVGGSIPATAYVNAHRMRGLLSESFARAFTDVEVIVAPTCPVTAALRGADTVMCAGREEPVSPAYVRLCVPSSLAGLPTASVPCGSDGGLPIGLQMIGAPYADDHLLAVTHATLRDLDQGERSLAV